MVALLVVNDIDPIMKSKFPIVQYSEYPDPDMDIISEFIKSYWLPSTKLHMREMEVLVNQFMNKIS